MSPPGRPKGEYRSAQRGGRPMSAAGPSQGTNGSPSGGGAAASLAWAASVGDP